MLNFGSYSILWPCTTYKSVRAYPNIAFLTHWKSTHLSCWKRSLIVFKPRSVVRSTCFSTSLRPTNINKFDFIWISIYMNHINKFCINCSTGQNINFNKLHQNGLYVPRVLKFNNIWCVWPWTVSAKRSWSKQRVCCISTMIVQLIGTKNVKIHPSYKRHLENKMY